MASNTAVQDKAESEDKAQTAANGAEDKTEEKPKKVKLPYVLTPYQATKLVNKALAEAGVLNKDGDGPKIVGSPMLYIYARAERFQIRRAPIDIERGAEKPRWEVFPVEDFQTWLDEYVDNAKNGKKSKKDKDEKPADSAEDEAPDADALSEVDDDDEGNEAE